MLSSVSFCLRAPSKFIPSPANRTLLTHIYRNVKYDTTIPKSSITEVKVEIHKTFLDTIGRTTLVIKARNLVDDFRDRELIVTYDYSLMAALRKPIIIFSSFFAVFVAAWVVGGVEMKFSKK